jgi:hypothetical protein
VTPHPRPANPGAWAERAGCINAGNLFVVTNNRADVADQRKTHAKALAICNRCPVSEDCYEWAMSDPEPAYQMIAGGLTPVERNLMRRSLRGVMKMKERR